MRYSPFLGPLLMTSTAMLVVLVVVAFGLTAVVAFHYGRRL